MSCLQVDACWSNGALRSASPSLIQSSCLRASYSYALPVHTFRLYLTLPRLVYASAKYQRPTCLFGDKGDANTNKEETPWKALEKAMGSFQKKPSLQDVLREQMLQQELSGDGGTRSPPGGGGGGDDGSGETEDESISGILEELLQVVLATIGLIFLYIYIITGDELTRLAKDYIKYLFGASTSVRLRRTMDAWGSFYQSLTTKEVATPDWLERAIVSTPTWWHKPRQLARVARSLMDD